MSKQSARRRRARARQSSTRGPRPITKGFAAVVRESGRPDRVATKDCTPPSEEELQVALGTRPGVLFSDLARAQHDLVLSSSADATGDGTTEAALRREYQRHGGEAKLGVSESEYVRSASSKFAPKPGQR